MGKRKMMLVSFMLFSLFFGAGNLIFPPFLGQNAGESTPLAIGAFLITAVLLPVLGVIVVADFDGLDNLARKVDHRFAIVFTVLIYLSIGPGLGIPRAASVPFEMAVAPYLPAAAQEAYASNPMVKGFLEGYQTMDTIAALNFGLVISVTIQNQGLNTILGLSVPVLDAIYPMSIVLIVLGLCDALLKNNRFIYPVTIASVGVVSILYVLDKGRVPLGVFGKILHRLPLYSMGLGWVTVAFAAVCVSIVLAVLLGGRKGKQVD